MALFTQLYTASGDEKRGCSQKQPVASIASQLARVHRFTSRIMAKMSPRSSKAPRQPAASRYNMRSRRTEEADSGKSSSRSSKAGEQKKSETGGGVNPWTTPDSTEGLAFGGVTMDKPEVVVPESKKVWFEPSSYCRIKNELATQLLQRGLDSASRALWNAFNKQYPAQCYNRWDDPTHINWGRDELYDLLDGSEPAIKLLFVNPSAGYKCLMNDLAELLKDDDEAAVVSQVRHELLAAARVTWEELKGMHKAVKEGQSGPFKSSKQLLRTFQDYGNQPISQEEKEELKKRGKLAERLAELARVDAVLPPYDDQTLTREKVVELVDYLEGKAKKVEHDATHLSF
ncbi:hypothetical protein Slin15195_G105220 [Septoria linicola]|uniref:Uncharacterized protein n=1 Tax=Septoria linicola TaxID=215465 RepID=A0A9Q9B1J9_9PEZI|nr:hypothetical protein Slin15195_G105220 [Septoria linicola]